MVTRAEALSRLGWYVGFLGIVILLGEIVDSVSILVDLNFSGAPLGSQHTPLIFALGAWVFGLVLLIWSAQDAFRSPA